jgi:hypothetical protein
MSSSRIMGLCLVKRVDRDLVQPRSAANFSVLRRALPRTKKGIFFNSRSASASQMTLSRPDRGGGSGGGASSGGIEPPSAAAGCAALLPHRAGGVAAVMRGPGGVVEFEILAEHGQQVFFQPHDQRMHPGVEQHVRALRTPSAASSGRGNPAHARAPRSRRRECPGACRCGVPSGCRGSVRAQAASIARLDLQVIVGDQRLEPELLGQARIGRANSRL